LYGKRTENHSNDTPAFPSAIEEAEAFGLDLSLNRESLRLSYEERAIRHQAALDLALEIERAGQKLRGEPQSAA
jgi:hypothetical protein